MQGILRFTVLFALSAILPTAAWADLAPGPGQRPRPRPMPAPEKKVASRLEVPAIVKKADLTKEGGAVQAKIVIPRKLLGDLAPPAAAAEPRASLGGSRSIFAGLALSMAAVSLVFVARGSRFARSTAAVGLIAGLAIASSTLWADVKIPGQPYKGPARRPEVERIDKVPVPTSVILEIVEEGDSITLVLPEAK